MSWKRFLALSCSHGNLADPDALKAVLKFKASWKPHRTLHLGDVFDFASLRSGADGTNDEGTDLFDDFHAGTRFLTQLEPTDVFVGNHCDRAYKLAQSNRAKVAYAAGRLVSDYETLAKDTLKAQLIPYDIDEGWLQLGDTLFGHGYMYSLNAIRDHAESVGKCVIGHLHRVGQERARVRRGATGYCVGFLGRKELFTYAKLNKQRFAWSQGFAWGEYSDAYCHVRLEQRTPDGWRLPL